MSVIAIGQPQSAFERRPSSADAALMLRAATHEGLLGFDAEGRVVPALAERWIVTEDGLSYIFRLRDDRWPDGKPITAESVRAALLAAIAAARSSQLGTDLRAISAIKVMATRVLEVSLSRPESHFLPVLARPELSLSYKGKPIGPLWLKREGDTAILSGEQGQQSETQDRKESLPTRTVRFAALPAEKAIANFDSGGVDVLVDGRLWDFPRANRFRLTGGSLRFDPVQGLFGLAVVSSRGFLGDAANREALAKAIDRNRLAAVVGNANWRPTTALIPAGASGLAGPADQDWAGFGLAERRVQAVATLTRWRKDRSDALSVRVALPDGPGADALAQFLTEDFAAIGVSLIRVGRGEAADLRMLDLVAPYPHARWYLDRLSCAAGNVTCDKAIDARLTKARTAKSPEDLLQLLTEAEIAAREANVFIPLGSPVRWSLVRGTVPGFAPNAFAIHPLMQMARAPK